MADPERLPVLLARAASLPEAQQRRVAAILGAVVADASGKAYETYSRVPRTVTYQRTCT